MSREVWDAYDKDGKKLGFDLYRDEYDKSRKGAYHLVVGVFTITKNKEVLITKRDEHKESYPSKWEISGGSAIKGESSRAGARRELFEETGLKTNEESLIPVYELYAKEEVSALYSCYVNVIEDSNVSIILQDGETCDYKFVTYDEFKKIIKGDDFVETFQNRFFEYEDVFDRIVMNL